MDAASAPRSAPAVAETTLFEGFHPAFAALYFAAVLGLTMCVLNPVTVCMSAVVGFVLHGRLSGFGVAGRQLAWQVGVLLVLTTLLNAVLSSAGSTVLFRLGPFCISFESVAFGACMGGLLVAMLQWFSCAAKVLTSSNVMALLGPVAPNVGLLLTMSMRLVPQFLRRGTRIHQVRSACTAAGNAPVRGMGDRFRQLTVLMSWGMEDSLESADAVRARGWGAAKRRTSYACRRFRILDAAACALLAALVALCVVCAVAACARFSFYPVISGFGPAVAYLPFAALLLVPAVLEVLHR
ncbi:MAG: energy-coupling factor transporter transmembrane component T [Coriobacteriia bacterium]|nr:energy-coupling factor transporter transmembrane component T [Coriobacteriia bacterium]